MAGGGAESLIQFGISVVPATEQLDRTRELVRAADEAGLDLIGIQDHPYQRHFLETWSLISVLLAETRRISFFTDVANLPLRPPAVMAKAAASLDVLSAGRFELGLGAGGIPAVISQFGGPRRTPGESVEALDEAIDVIRLLWSEEQSVSFDGKHYRLDDARPGPRPVHSIGIWVGAFKPRMLRLVGRKADGWLPSLGVLTRDELRAGNEQIDAAAEKEGRAPRSIRRIINMHGLIGDARAVPVGAPGRVSGGRTTRRTARLVGRHARGLRGGRLRHACLLAGGHLSRPGRAARRRSRTALAPVRLIPRIRASNGCEDLRSFANAAPPPRRGRLRAR
jgi:alkanesulfonate monooxygenase SsuD/methylene tetrahydromethanopterin reductase-like flavin-dependent oxidoreductase (luciferase family)